VALLYERVVQMYLKLPNVLKTSPDFLLYECIVHMSVKLRGSSSVGWLHNLQFTMYSFCVYAQGN
jgi:hypothetical protein